MIRTFISSVLYRPQASDNKTIIRKRSAFRGDPHVRAKNFICGSHRSNKTRIAIAPCILGQKQILSPICVAVMPNGKLVLSLTKTVKQSGHCPHFWREYNGRHLAQYAKFFACVQSTHGSPIFDGGRLYLSHVFVNSIQGRKHRHWFNDFKKVGYQRKVNSFLTQVLRSSLYKGNN